MANRICSVEDCDSPLLAKDLCSRHYARRHRTGSVELSPRVRTLRLCSVDDCDEIHMAKDYCKTHYWRWRKHGSPHVVRRREPCSVAGCNEVSTARHLCEKHYTRFRRHGHTGDPLPGKSLLDRDARGRKQCSSCKTWRVESSFCASSYNPDGLDHQCAACRSAAAKVSRLARYGLTLESYVDLLAAQGGICACCGIDASVAVMCIDHDHACCPGKNSCGKCVRGLLCRQCNVGLGYFGDDPARLLAAASYLAAAGQHSLADQPQP